MQDSSYRFVLAAIIVAGGVFVFALSRDKLRGGFVLFILTLGIGYRTFPVTPSFRILPAELLLWALAACLPGSRRLEKRPAQARRLPLWLCLLLPFWAWAWNPFGNNTVPWDVKIAEFRNFLLAVPLFLVCRRVLAKEDAWRPVIATCYAMCVWIGLMGAVEYLYPGIAYVLPGFIADPNPSNADGFLRASFSFYGSPIAVFSCVMFLPVGSALWRWFPAAASRLAIALGGLAQLAGIYISGYRSMWLLVAIQFTIVILITRNYLLAITVVLIAILSFDLMPSAGHRRLYSLARVIEGAPVETDTSGMKRWTRAVAAWEHALANPIGDGWGASGWVHSDFIQIAANQGLGAALIFLLGYLSTLRRIAAVALKGNSARSLEVLAIPLLLGFVAVGGILLYEGVEFLPQTILPLWLSWALVENFVNAVRRASVASPQVRYVQPTPALAGV